MSGEHESCLRGTEGCSVDHRGDVYGEGSCETY